MMSDATIDLGPQQEGNGPRKAGHMKNNMSRNDAVTRIMKWSGRPLDQWGWSRRQVHKQGKVVVNLVGSEC